MHSLKCAKDNLVLYIPQPHAEDDFLYPHGLDEATARARQTERITATTFMMMCGCENKYISNISIEIVAITNINSVQS